MELKKHRRLTLKERVQIETLLNENRSKAYLPNGLKDQGPQSQEK